MSEITEMILNGDMCQLCGQYILDDNGELIEGDGYPVFCEDCE